MTKKPKQKRIVIKKIVKKVVKLCKVKRMCEFDDIREDRINPDYIYW